MQLQIDQADFQLKPKLICLTPVKNEAWCLDVFLTCTSLWADHIILADQNSTDGSQEIALRYPKVKLILNNSKVFNEDDRQKLLINESRKILGDKILFALDADEIFTANFIETNDWQRILNSRPGEVFGFQWANICPDRKRYFQSSFYYPWVFHDDGITEHINYVRWMHSMRIPFPKHASTGYKKVKDFKVFHFAWIDQRRVESKNRFYQCLVCINDPNEHFISIFRSYHQRKERTKSIPPKWIEKYKNSNIGIIENLNLSAKIYWYDIEVKKQFKIHGFSRFKHLDIWNSQWIDEMKNQIEIDDPRNLYLKVIHFYLKTTQNISASIPIRFIDKVLKILF